MFENRLYLRSQFSTPRLRYEIGKYLGKNKKKKVLSNFRLFSLQKIYGSKMINHFFQIAKKYFQTPRSQSMTIKLSCKANQEICI